MCAKRGVGLFIKRATPRRPARITGDEVTPQSQQQPSSLAGTSEPGCTYACYMLSVRSLRCCGATAPPTPPALIYGARRNSRYGDTMGENANLTKSLKNTDVF